MVVTNDLTAMDIRFAGDTVNVVEACTLPLFADTGTEPGATGLTIPVEFTAATCGAPLLQVTTDVTSREVPFVNVAIAVSCPEVPKGITVDAALISNATIAASDTFRLAEPVLVPMTAEIINWPGAPGVTNPEVVILPSFG